MRRVEVGGLSLERKRHEQFEADRIGHTEDFRLSDALTDHVVSLSTSRDTWFNRAMQEDSSLQVVYYLTDGPLTPTDLTQ